MAQSELGINLGHLFEVGFNIGILTYIKQHQLKQNFGNHYTQQLKNLKLKEIVKKVAIKESIIDENNRKIIEKWVLFFLQKSFLAGINFFREYLNSLELNERSLKKLEIIYYQCSFSGANSINTNGDENDLPFQQEILKKVLSQLQIKTNNLDLDQIIKQYHNKKGEFLQADTLILLQFRQKLRIICLDFSVFTIKSIKDLLDVNSVEELKTILLKEISYLKSKSVFANLGLDTKNTPLNISNSLNRYYHGFKTKDKETVKLIQAGSYAHSFKTFLENIGLLNNTLSVIYNIIGYSDRGISTMTLNQDNCDKILATCAHTYHHELNNKSIGDTRQEMFDNIKRNAQKSFENGKNLIENIVNLQNITQEGITTITHQEKITNFTNINAVISSEVAQQFNLDPNLKLRDAHAELITQQLDSDITYLFLTGNPGIGKTTAISEFLKSEKILNEGFLFFYVSPRKQVNLDIIEKFKALTPQPPLPSLGEGELNNKILADDRLLAITTNADLIRDNGEFYQPIVSYLSNQYQDNFTEKTVLFIDQRNELNNSKYRGSLKRKTEDLIKDSGVRNRGVLDSMCEAIYALLNTKKSNNIVATVAIQSLKKTRSGDTLDHFEKIFKDLYNKNEKKAIIPKMQELASRIKHIFIMIDEITGDDSGVEFLKGISNILRKYEFLNNKFGFNVKIIVADASIVEAKVINQHLANIEAEPNKIFFRKANQNNGALSVQNFNFENHQAIVINTNSYPAKSLNIHYKLFVDLRKFKEETYKDNKLNLTNKIQKEIITKIKHFLNNNNQEQIIIYIQDKTRLVDLIEKIQEQGVKFEKYQEYLEIHASLSEQEKSKISQYQNEVKVIFMTASASRGLSFPKATKIFVDLPRFEIEKNLMEIIQVIYRGRGSYRENNERKTFDNDDKELYFYLSEQAIYYDNKNDKDQEMKETSLRESTLNLLNILLILKASIMTRIVGYGKIGNENYMMIPIGGKSVFAAGQTFSSNINNLIKQLKKEHKKHPKFTNLKRVYTDLETLLSSVIFTVRNTENSANLEKRSYLELINTLKDDFFKKIQDNFAKLLDFSLIETGYINGILLIVPLKDKKVEENYKMRIEQDLKNFNEGQLIKDLKSIYLSENTPENLKSALKEALNFVDILGEEPLKTQNLEQFSQYDDQYYLLPLFAFISPEIMLDYFSGNEEEPEDLRFKDILEAYIRAIYPVSNILPIGYKYQEFPFLLFRSYSLKELRNKLFTDKYLLTSNELNILNLILDQDG